MNLLTLDEIPKEHKELFFQLFETALQHNKTQTQAKSEAEESFCYLLTLFWQSRYDKMSTSHVRFFDWISWNLLPKNLEYEGLKNRTLLIKQPDSYNEVPEHRDIAADVFASLWFAYERTEGSSFKVKQNVFEKIVSFFKRS